ncbi:hypothetical protein [Trinickia terrae]|nr:hypothetical protein [Trinickia terrae]
MNSVTFRRTYGVHRFGRHAGSIPRLLAFATSRLVPVATDISR